MNYSKTDVNVDQKTIQLRLTYTAYGVRMYKTLSSTTPIWKKNCFK